MTPWQAIVPVKQGDAAKSRLNAVLTQTERQRLAAAMARHVLATLASVERIGAIRVLSRTRDSDLPADWVADRGRGLNVEATRAVEQAGGAPTLVIHADLPCVAPSDLSGLLAAAERSGAALAPDRHGTGTNAVALADASRFAFAFAFGFDSLARHRAMLPRAAIVRRRGLAHDVDTPADLAALGDLESYLAGGRPARIQPHAVGLAVGGKGGGR